MTRKLLCLNVELLQALDRAQRIYSFGTPTPKLCSAFVTSSLIKTIDNALALMEKNDLLEVTVHSKDVNWFSSLDDRIYQRINANLHITRDSIYYTGAFEPEKIPVFTSTRLPISSIAPPKQTQPKELNLSLLSSNAAKALIAEIENLDKEMQIAWERQESLEELNTAIESLKTASLIAASTKTNALAQEVSNELKQLINENESLESRIEKKCEILCKTILGVSVGDHILTQTHYKNKNQEIQIQSVRYYNNTIYLDGPKVLKSGLLGKRSESAHVTLVPDNEH